MSQDFKPGLKIGHGRYTLQSELGRGGMGVVWLALDSHLDEQVALKFLPPDLAGDKEAIDSLKREVSKSRRLSHPNIVRIHDLVLSEDEVPFVSLEYIDGANMSDVKVQQEDRLFTWEQIRSLIRQLCSALDYAHSQKVVHRDLKPGNMMLDREGRLRLADFGLAATLNESMSRMTADLGSSGTPPYMSPQQIDGRVPKAADDIYALGATIYEFLTSKPPFYSGDILHQVRTLPPQPMDERLEDLELENEIPPDVAAMVMACLAKDRDHRPPTARAVAEWIGLDTGDFVNTPTASSTAVPSSGAVGAPELESFVTTPDEPDSDVVMVDSEASTVQTGVSQEEWEEAFPEDAPRKRGFGSWVKLAAVLLLGAFALMVIAGKIAKRNKARRAARTAAAAETSKVEAADPTMSIGPASNPGEWIDLMAGRVRSNWQSSVPGRSPAGSWDLTSSLFATKNPGRGTRASLVSVEKFADFELQLEFWLPPKGNSGIFYFAPSPFATSGGVCPEFQLVDNDRSSDGGHPLRQTGAVYNIMPAYKRARGLTEQWNKLRLVAKDGYVMHEVNGDKLRDYNMNSFEWNDAVDKSAGISPSKWKPARPGHIVLQNHASVEGVKFRSIRIRRLN